MKADKEKNINLLALETTGKYCSVAVINGAGDIHAKISDSEMNHLRDITQLSSETIKNAGIDKKNITHVATSVGPGSFTGIRIGVATARTLSQVMDIPCIGVSSLESMALKGFDYHLRNIEKKSDEDILVAPIINARRHQTYAGVWKMNDGKLDSICAPRQYMIEELIALLNEFGSNILFIGDGIDAYSDIIEKLMPKNKYSYVDIYNRYNDAGFIAQIALQKIKKGEITNYEDVVPDYMRITEAEQKLKEKNTKKFG